jgi:hypothetical protein
MIKRLVGLGVITALALGAGPAQAQVKKTEILAAIKAAFAKWEAIDCSNLKFKYAGALDKRTEKKAGAIVFNFVADSADWVHNEDAVFATSHHNLDDKGDISDGTIEINAVKYAWSLGKDPKKLDIQTTVTRLIPMTIGFYVGYYPAQERVKGLLQYGLVDHELLDLHKTGAQFSYFQAGSGCTQPAKPEICGPFWKKGAADAGVSDAAAVDAAVADAAVADAAAAGEAGLTDASSSADANVPLELCIYHSRPTTPKDGKPYHWETQPIEYWVYLPDNKGKLPGSTNIGGDGGLDSALGDGPRHCKEDKDCPGGQTCQTNGTCSGGSGGEVDDGCCRISHTRAENVTYSILLLFGLAFLIRRGRSKVNK